MVTSSHCQSLPVSPQTGITAPSSIILPLFSLYDLTNSLWSLVAGLRWRLSRLFCGTVAGNLVTSLICSMCEQTKTNLICGLYLHTKQRSLRGTSTKAAKTMQIKLNKRMMTDTWFTWAAHVTLELRFHETKYEGTMIARTIYGENEFVWTAVSPYKREWYEMKT